MKLLKKYVSKNYIIILFSAVALTFCSSPAESDTLNYSDDLEKVIETTAVEDLSSAEEEGLIFMREEEKLARDVYINLYQKWNLNVFNNISKAEQKHTDAVKMLLDRYGLDDPMQTDDFGVFKNENLQNLYNSLTETGSESIEAALKVGGAIEEIDILDLEKQLNENVDNEDIALVYNNLMRGSRNHLRAFVKNMENQGITYSPQYMTEDEYKAIIESDMERGGNGGHGHGKGKRRGGGRG